ncbi:MAG: hypothetical protein A2Y88_10215 [Chloroflexi bacterium RBG_13_48_10]|nr:MAG: hypothetical protein A2Y88_10215 [Chloroflexi bacterium RBG_13_48_10]
MKTVIGIDTGGTYTDAVLLDKVSGIVRRKAKAITTPDDLSMGIAQAIKGLGEVNYKQVQMVSISTTLATNAIVEGQGGRVALLLIGYDQELMEEQGLAKRLPVVAMYYIGGGHDVKGEEAAPLDTDSAIRAIREIRDQVDAFAVSGYFSVLNPDHEIRIRNLIQEQTSAPVVCGHELTSKLNALKRVSTVVLNARLLPLISHLLDSVKKVLNEIGCHSRLMVVKGDGSLISEGMARQCPVDTILSGPAASAIGAEFLANVSDAIVVDMGGTTTDIAILEKGLPWNNPAGAVVGGWQTCVQAADLRTIGIGGDSHIQVDEGKALRIGPRRAIPLFRLGAQCPEIVQELGNRAITDWTSEGIQPTDYLAIVNSVNGISLSQTESKLINALRQSPKSLIRLRQIVGDNLHQAERLEMLGIVRRAGLTPSDVLFSVTNQIGGNEEAAHIGTKIIARQLRISVDEVSRLVLQKVSIMIAKEILDKLVSDMTFHSLFSAPLAWEKLLECLLGDSDFPDLSGYIKVRKPIIAIGAPVACFIPHVADRLHTQCIIPAHAEVGNAVGAAVASITHTVEILVQPHLVGSDTLTYLVHLPQGREVFTNQEEAVRRAETVAKEIVSQRFYASGEKSFSVSADKQYVNMGALSEVTVRACATNRLLKRSRLNTTD